MAKKQHFLIIDTETTINDHVADFGALVCDRKGNIIKDCAILVGDFYGKERLFHDPNANDIWGYAGLIKREEAYARMLLEGTRSIATVAAINRWLEKVAATYAPTMTAYNLAFDASKMANSGIDVSMFPDRFCLWHAAAGIYGGSKEYRRFVLANHLFNAPTALGNMTYKTNAEVMASYLSGSMLPPEPHTAIEDARLYELPILLDIVKKRNWRERLKPYCWQDYQVRDHFTV